MSFVSYAQNFEDLMLWRALQQVEHGFYLDIGALSPNFDTVTKAFYDRGWRGINVEPNPKYLAELQEWRPEDTNLGVVVSDQSGPVQFNIFDNPGLSTMESIVAGFHRDNGMASQAIEAEAMTLLDIWHDHVPPGQDVHFLKIDVEGHEAAVVRGGHWKACRPWILVVEATYPNSQTLVHEEWEPLVLDAGYEFAYWDGLNRYYLAEEHRDLHSAFETPPNVFDNYELARYMAPLADLKTQLDETSKARDAALRARDAADQTNLQAGEAYTAAIKAFQAKVEEAAAMTHAYGAERSTNEELMRSLDIERQAVKALTWSVAKETNLKNREAKAKDDAWKLLDVERQRQADLARGLAIERTALKDAEDALRALGGSL